jgi:hypothetical protein
MIRKKIIMGIQVAISVGILNRLVIFYFSVQLLKPYGRLLQYVSSRGVDLNRGSNSSVGLCRLSQVERVSG